MSAVALILKTSSAEDEEIYSSEQQFGGVEMIKENRQWKLSACLTTHKTLERRISE